MNAANAFLHFATGDTYRWRLPTPSEICTGSIWRQPKNAQSQHRCTLRALQQLQHVVSIHALAESSPDFLNKYKNTLIHYHLTAGTQFRVLKSFTHRGYLQPKCISNSAENFYS